MRAAMFYEPDNVRMEDVPELGEVLLRMGAGLTCGTGIKYEIQPPNGWAL